MLQKIIKQKPYLAWDIKNAGNLSDESSLEHILAYGDWDDIQEAEKLIGISEMKSLFEKLIQKKRKNLKPRTILYFQNYFAKYA